MRACRGAFWGAAVLLSSLSLASTAQGEAEGEAVDPAMTGASQYAAHCAACHGATLDGFDHAPPLRGEGFLSGWAGEKQRKLYSRIISTMPANDPGSLDPADVLAITQLVLKMNKIEIAPASSADELNERVITPH